MGVDFGARDSATIGGMVATNAGGVNVLRHGAMRRQIAGIEAVLGTGPCCAPPGLLKDNTGYDLAGLLCGSEGTLGIVTAVRLRLVPAPALRASRCSASPTSADAVAAAGAPPSRPALRSRPPSCSSTTGSSSCAPHLGSRRLRRPAPACTCCSRCADAADPTDELPRPLGAAAGSATRPSPPTRPGGHGSGATARRTPRRSTPSGVPHKLDVTLPLGALAALRATPCRHVVARSPDAPDVLFGHVGDGNVHVNVIGAAPDDERVDDAVLDLVAELGGSDQRRARHRHGEAWTGWSETGAEDAVAAMRAIKRAWDPAGILNPGVIFGSRIDS